MKLTKTVLAIVALALVTGCEEGFNSETPARDGGAMANGVEPAGSEHLVLNYRFTGEEGDPISLETARRWTSQFSGKNPTGNRAHFFGFEILTKILAQEGCVGIRMYYALDDSGSRQLVLVGVNADGENLLPGSMQLMSDDDHTIADASFPCPSFCPPPGDF